MSSRDSVTNGRRSDQSEKDPSLVVVGPDGRRFGLGLANGGDTLASLVHRLLELHYSEMAESADGPYASFRFVYLKRDGSQVPVRTDTELNSLPLASGDELRIGNYAAAGGNVWVDLAEFAATAVASGVAGNAVYDLVKAAGNRLSKLRSKRGSRDEHAEGPPTDDVENVEAAQLAIGVTKLNLGLDERSEVSVVSAERSDGGSEGVSWKVAVKVAGGAPLESEVRLVVIRVSGDHDGGMEVLLA